MKFNYPEGATPIDQNQIVGIIPTHLVTQQDLNEWEAQNILEAKNWAFTSRRTKDILTISFIQKLHKKMFGKTWIWAGEFRRTQTNIGVEPHLIFSHLGHLLSDTQYWLSHKTYDLDEIAARLHHKLVYLHCFPNGNGRHARLYADIFLVDHNKPSFTWGNKELTKNNLQRHLYIESLKAADQHDYAPLLQFVRS
jgi:Fic-DOC domain mobile mystery protein B